MFLRSFVRFLICMFRSNRNTHPKCYGVHRTITPKLQCRRHSFCCLHSNFNIHSIYIFSIIPIRVSLMHLIRIFTFIIWILYLKIWLWTHKLQNRKCDFYCVYKNEYPENNVVYTRIRLLFIIFEMQWLLVDFSSAVYFVHFVRGLLAIQAVQ